MRTIGRILILTALAATAATALAWPSVAAAEQTTLCMKDAAECTEQATSWVHLTSVGKAKLLAEPRVECNVLFSKTSVGASGSPQIIEGHFRYTNCGCSGVKEVAGTTARIEVLMTGHETANVTGEAEVEVVCFGIHCTYNGEGLTGTAKGPLLSTEANGEVNLSEQVVTGSGTFCPSSGKLDIKLTPLEAIYIASKGSFLPKEEKEKAEPTEQTTLCKEDAKSACAEPVSSVHLTSVGKAKLLASPRVECNVLFSSTSVGATGSPQIIEGHYTYTNCGCTVREVAGTTARIEVLKEGHETASVTGEAEVEVVCFGIECTYNGESLEATAKGPLLSTEANGEVNLSEQVVIGEGAFCPSKGKLDIKLTPLSATYIAGSPTSLCSKDEGSPFCKSESQLKSIDYKDKAVELLTNLINVKCEGLVSGAVGEPGNPLEVKPELTFSNCSEGCFVTVVSGPGKVLLQREGKAEEAKATAEGFEIFVKCGTTIKCLLGPEKMAGTALGALTTGDNGHLTFSKASLGKGEGATCPTEATLDATYVASSAAYIG